MGKPAVPGTSESAGQDETKNVPKFPAQNWGTLKKAPLSTRAERDTHIRKLWENIPGLKHHTLTTSLRKAKTFLEENIFMKLRQTVMNAISVIVQCFHSFKKDEDPHQLKLALCITTGAVAHA